MKKKQAAEKPDRHKKKGKSKPGLTFAERRRLAELKHRLAGTNKNAEKPTTAQKTITFQKMYRDGICQVTSGFYTKMVEFYDIKMCIRDRFCSYPVICGCRYRGSIKGVRGLYQSRLPVNQNFWTRCPEAERREHEIFTTSAACSALKEQQ